MAKPQKNTQCTLVFAMLSTSSPGTFASGQTVTKAGYYQDGTGSFTSLSIAASVAEIGSTGLYTLTLTASEMNHDKIVVKLTSSGGQDNYLFLELDTSGIADVKSDTAAILLDTGTDGVVISSTMANRIADYTLRRNFANITEGDTKAFRSLLGAGSKLVNKFVVSGGSAIVYEYDDATTLGTQTITTDAAADPITGFDTV